MTFKVKLVSPHSGFTVSCRYSCETCGKLTLDQTLTVLAQSPTQ